MWIDDDDDDENVGSIYLTNTRVSDFQTVAAWQPTAFGRSAESGSAL